MAISTGRSLVLASLLALAATPAIGAFPEPQGSEPQPGLTIDGRDYRRLDTQANVYTTSSQGVVSLDQDAAGRTVVVWQSKRQELDGSLGIYARRFDVTGAPLGDEVHLNQHQAGDQHRPAVALELSGVAWVVWESYDQDGSQGGIVARRLAPELDRGTGEVIVNEVGGGPLTGREGHQAEPSLAVDGTGGAVVVWTSPDGRGRIVLARRMGTDGAPAGPVFRVDQEESAANSLPCVAVDPEGTLTVVWARADPDGVPSAIVGRRFGLDGAALGDELELSRGVPGLPVEPSLARGSGGRLLVGWLTAVDHGYVPAVRLARVEGGELVLGRARLLEPGVQPGHTSGLGVDLGAERALVAWSRFGDERGCAGLWATFLDAELEPESEPFRVTEVSVGHQRLAAAHSGRHLFLAEDGRMAFAWDGKGTGDDASGAQLTLLAPADLEDAAPQVRAEATAVAPVLDLPSERADPHEPPVFSGGAVDRGGWLGQENLGGPDFGFLGITQTQLSPPDPHLAVGPDHVVQVVNGAIAWFTKTGTLQQQVDSAGVNGFWASLGASGFIFDPEVLYDPHSGRFFVTFCERAFDPYFLLAVSDDSDPNGTWHKYRFRVRNESGGGNDIESPNMAVDRRVLYLTANFHSPDRYLVYILQKAPLLSGATNPKTRSLLVTGPQSMGLPVTYDVGGGAQYMIEASKTYPGDSVRFHAILNPLTAPVRRIVTVSVPTYSLPEDPPQLGTSVRPETFDARFWSCVYRNGSLWATHHTGDDRVLQRWYEFDMRGWPFSGQRPVLVQSGDVDPGPGIRTFFGSIWADEDGNAGMTFARSSTTEWISMGRTFRSAGDPLGTMTPMQIMRNSTVPEPHGRWGDYSGIASEPGRPGAFWATHEFRAGPIWATWIGLLGPCQPPQVYCTAKVTSLGHTPRIGSSGEPSLTANNFVVTMREGPPNRNGILFSGPARNSAPFQGGILCVAPPLDRGEIFMFTPAGTADRPITVSLELVGLRRFYQFWFRDPPAPDGTTVGLSDGLEVLFCP